MSENLFYDTYRIGFIWIKQDAYDSDEPGCDKNFATWTISYSYFNSYPHWVPLSYGLVPHLSKKLSKFTYFNSYQNRDDPKPDCHYNEYVIETPE